MRFRAHWRRRNSPSICWNPYMQSIGTPFLGCAREQSGTYTSSQLACPWHLRGCLRIGLFSIAILSPPRWNLVLLKSYSCARPRMLPPYVLYTTLRQLLTIFIQSHWPCHTSSHGSPTRRGSVLGGSLSGRHDDDRLTDSGK